MSSTRGDDLGRRAVGPLETDHVGEFLGQSTLDASRVALEIMPAPSAPGGLIATDPLALDTAKLLPLRRVRPSGFWKVATGSW
jgi:hypothetical protein